MKTRQLPDTLGSFIAQVTAVKLSNPHTVGILSACAIESDECETVDLRLENQPVYHSCDTVITDRVWER